MGRSDKYIDNYFGRERGAEAWEIATRALQTAFRSIYDKPTVPSLLKDDPETLDLARLVPGLLLHFDP